MNKPKNRINIKIKFFSFLLISEFRGHFISILIENRESSVYHMRKIQKKKNETKNCYTILPRGKVYTDDMTWLNNIFVILIINIEILENFSSTIRTLHIIPYWVEYMTVINSSSAMISMDFRYMVLSARVDISDLLWFKRFYGMWQGTMREWKIIDVVKKAGVLWLMNFHLKWLLNYAKIRILDNKKNDDENANVNVWI